MAQLWVIERDMESWSDEDIEAGGIRAKMCVLWYPNMKWIRTFHDREGERTLCIYEAASEADIRTHALAAGLPCGNVIPVDELLPGDLDEPVAEARAEGAGSEAPSPLRVGEPG